MNSGSPHESWHPSGGNKGHASLSVPRSGSPGANDQRAFVPLACHPGAWENHVVLVIWRGAMGGKRFSRRCPLGADGGEKEHPQPSAGKKSGAAALLLPGKAAPVSRDVCRGTSRGAAATGTEGPMLRTDQQARSSPLATVGRGGKFGHPPGTTGVPPGLRNLGGVALRGAGDALFVRSRDLAELRA